MKTNTLIQSAIREGCLILINEQFPLEDSGHNANKRLCPVGNNVMLDKAAAIPLRKLVAEINGQKKILPVSGWRSKQEQEELFLQSVKDNGLEFTRKSVAKPGCSEHQTGLAIDLALNKEYVDFIRPSFPYWGIAQTFRDKAPSYGFIERYPKGKEFITGIGHEPWHFRFVGVPHAQIMAERQFTLEEYHAFIMQFAYGESTLRYAVGGRTVRISHLNPHTLCTMDRPLFKTDRIAISGNNIDGFIVTEWGE